MSDAALTGFADVVLVQAGKKKTDVVLALREVTAKESVVELIDLAMARRLTDQAPCVALPDVPVDVGQRIKAWLEKAGTVVELKPA